MKKMNIIILAIIAGCINGMFSTGAGLVLIPAFVLIFKYDEYMARGTTLFIIILLCLINIIIYSHKYSFQIYMLPIILGGIIGSLIGRKVVYMINRKFLSIFFAIFTIIMGIGMIR